MAVKNRKYKNEKAVDIIFTGLIRTQDKFKDSIKDLVQLHKEGLVNQIIFSTWDYEVDKYPRMREFLADNKINLIENIEPYKRGIGNIWCQMKSLDAALKEIDSTSFVLKTRCDLYINPNFLRKLFLEKEKLLKIKKDLPKGNIFKYKIWIHYYELKTPFHMGEECLLAHHHDMDLMVNYESSYDENYKIGDALSHIRRFIHPFIQDYPILKEYLKTYSKDSFLKTLAIKFSHKVFDLRGLKIARKISSKNKFSVLEKKLSSVKFIDILAAYYSILYSHFYVDGNSFPDQVVSKVWNSPGKKLDQYEFTKNLREEMSHPAQPGQIYVYDMELLNNICNKKLKKDPISERLMVAIDKFNSQ